MYALMNMLQNFANTNQNEVFKETMQRNKSLSKLITKLNTENQLKYGKLSDDTILPNYSQRSIEEFGKQNIPIQLKDTGEFWKSFNVTLTDDGFEIDGQSIKYDYEPIDLVDLVDYYGLKGENIYGLNSENLSLFNQTLIIKLEETIKKILSKKN